MKGCENMKNIELIKLVKTADMSKVTQKAIDDFNSMNAKEFLYKYYCTKEKYFKRVIKYGDPYMKAPLARLGKFLSKIM
jgi:hypothetical protein